MTNDEKQPLLKDLFARVLYGVKVCFDDIKETTLSLNELRYIGSKHVIKPYLRPMSSMTEEEREELNNVCKRDNRFSCRADSNPISGFYNPFGRVISLSDIDLIIDWFNEHHFDHRGLIEKGLALEAPEGMYK